jgi:hypothetical protein
MIPNGPEWESWPVRRSPARGLLAAAVIVGSAWGTWAWTGSAALTGFALVVLLVATGSFFFPTHYRLTRDGVEIERPWRRQSRPWQDFRGIRRGGNLVVLSPFERESWLDGFRGVTLLLPEERGEVLDYVEEMVGKEARAGTG